LSNNNNNYVSISQKPNYKNINLNTRDTTTDNTFDNYDDNTEIPNFLSHSGSRNGEESPKIKVVNNG